jgi:hypothetical protein
LIIEHRVNTLLTPCPSCILFQWSRWHRLGLIGGAGSIVHSWSQARKVGSLNFDGWPNAFDNILVIEFSGLFNPGENHEHLSFVHRALVLDQPVNVSFVRDVLSLRQFVSFCTSHTPQGHGHGAGLADVDEKYAASETSQRSHRLSSSRTVPHQEQDLRHYRWMLEDFDEAFSLTRSRWKGSVDSEAADSAPPTHRSCPILSYRRASHHCSYLQDSNRTTYPIIARPRKNKGRADDSSPSGTPQSSERGATMFEDTPTRFQRE